MAQSVEYPTPDFGSGHDLGVMGWSPMLGIYAQQGICLKFSLSLSFYPSFFNHEKANLDAFSFFSPNCSD